MIRRLIASILATLGIVTASPSDAAKPLVAILADPKGSEATDLIAPYSILAESGTVDVRIVAPRRAPVRLMPGMAWVEPQATLAETPAPQVVIVPALHDAKDPTIQAWLKAQAARGARIMSICDGAIVLAEAGLLDGKQATAHWFSRDRLARRHAEVRWRSDRRWVTDGRVTTTSGVSASAPATLALLAELSGEQTMRETAARLNLPTPSVAHTGDAYRLSGWSLRTASANTLAFWTHEDVAVVLSPGFDELAFAITLDGWSRTYRSTAWAAGKGPFVSRRGLTIQVGDRPPARFDRTLALGSDGFEGLFRDLTRAYGGQTARFVALQLEHPYGADRAP